MISGQRLRYYAAVAERERMRLLAEGRIKEPGIPPTRVNSVKALVNRLHTEGRGQG